MTSDRTGAQDSVAASVRGNEGVVEGPRVVGIGQFRHFGATGGLIDEWTEYNLVTDTGRANYLKAELKGDDTVQASSWFVGLIQGETTNITLSTTDTASSTSLGWSESTN